MGREFAECSKGRRVSYSLYSPSDYRATDLVTGWDGTRFRVEGLEEGRDRFRVRIPGRINILNALPAISLAVELGLPYEIVAKGIENVTSVTGRFETVDLGQPFRVVVDYAHTDAALQNLLDSLSELEHERIITVFGCGGDRDKSKRPRMGRVVTSGSDVSILTSDNPRKEDPGAIIEDVLKGVKRRKRKGGRFFIEPDRRKAIFKALRMAGPGDVVLVAGKGHETYQDLGNEIIPFDDREVVEEALRESGFGFGDHGHDNIR